MQVVATAGHVDHGKSTLVRALTGMEPDRWAEERRRGLTIDLGFAWTTLSTGKQLAFVDVPGHERFVPNMLAGVGPVPACVFVVAADEGWMPQSAEHLAALDALAVGHGLLVISRCDLAEPDSALEQARRHLAGTSLADIPSVAVSAKTGAGISDVRAALASLRLPVPDAAADVRLWVDRSFSVRGVGTVVTGTLAAGTLRVGDELELHGERVMVRGLQSLESEVDVATAVARVAVNLRGLERSAVGRGDALLTPDSWWTTDTIDVRLRTFEDLPRELVLHLGSAAVPARVRPLDATTARLQLAKPLPLRVGDRALLRDPGRHLIAAGLEVLDVHPPALRRRGAAIERAAALAEFDAAASQLRDRTFVRAAELRAMGLEPTGRQLAGDWLVDSEAWSRLLDRARTEFASWQGENPLAGGIPIEVLRQQLDVPAEVVPELIDEAGLTEAKGLPRELDVLVRIVERELVADPFAAPTADRLAELALGPRELAVAARAGRLVRLADTVVLLPTALDRALEMLGELPQPFTLSQAREALGTTRRVALPLLELLHKQGRTGRLPDGTHRVRNWPVQDGMS
ncbi:selenocysteine-specific translation elongation factor [Tenggerimyces flavus]|uniref:Selenocysteine-specific elongation factor n=1 Tax=Tenggerimyces flavus TaxID=1708749 RepID=A0ABV7YCP8_9ACTN|nr:selenocysteine-specific translation elongation factor [Tenggerimyces flavus]MBM7783383.1 selenocysteine-specific elongation factor [Tenggerimyces flavus]